MIEMRVYGVVYVATNHVNDKRYIGQTIQAPEKRRREHIFAAMGGGAFPFYRAIRKYGIEAFDFTVVYIAFDKEALDIAEDALITELNTLTPGGYNARRGGSRGMFSDETRERMRESARRVAAAMPDLTEFRVGNLRKFFSDPNNRAQIGVRIRRWYDADPERRVVAAERTIQQFSVSGAREAAGERTRRQFANPEKRVEAGNRSREWFSDPDNRAKHRNAFNSIDTKARMSRAATRRNQIRFADLEYREFHAERCRSPARCDKLRRLHLGTLWITNEVRSAKIRPGDPIPPDWRLGRPRRTA